MLAFWVCKRFWSETVHWNVLRTLHNPKKQPSRNIRIAVKFLKIPKSIILIFAIKNTPPRVISWEFSRIFQNSCFKEHIRTAASEIIWGNRRDGFLFHRCSRPEIFSSLEKIRENSQEKICVGVLFLILTTKTLYDG